MYVHKKSYFSAWIILMFTLNQLNMKRILLLSISFLFVLGTAWAQRTVSGKVVSESDNSGIPGVNVVLKGTTTGVTTDLDGNYRLSIPEDGGTLVFSFIGLSTQEVVIGSRSVIDVTMSEDVETLSEVVVTAIGFEREKKALGYAVTSVGEELISKRPEADVSRVLQGKVPGVNITSTSGISGTGTNIIIRGYSSISGGNQPLFVVDGVPFNTNTNQQNSFAQGGVTSSSRFLDLDPNSIESINVLKGLAATVLYGDQGRNGVILVTTKSGSGKKRPAEINLQQSVFANKIASLPVYQNNYGGGFHQNIGFFFSNYGPHFDEVDFQRHPIGSSGVASIRNAFPQFRDDALISTANPFGAIDYAYQAYDDPGTAFFRTGVISNTSLQVSGGTDKTSVSASFGRQDEEGFTPGNTLQRLNFGLGLNSAITEKISLKSSFTFARTNMETPPLNAGFGSNANGGIPSMFANVLYTPRNIDLKNLPFENPVDRSSVYYRGGNDITNPLWLAKYYKNTSNVNRFFNSTSLTYNLSPDFTLTYRLGLDTYSENQEQQYNKGGGNGQSALTQSGVYRTLAITNTIWNQDLVLGYSRKLPGKLNLTALLGANTRYDEYRQDGITSTGQLAFGLFRHSNFTTSSSRDAFSGGNLNFTEEQQRMGIYTSVTLDYSDFVFLNLSARNDWTSNFEKENRSILYPGASVSFLPTTAFNWTTAAIDDLKIRLGYGTSAGYGNPYQTRSVLAQNARAFQSASGTLYPSHSVSNFLGNPNLKPELHEEIEFGIESNMFKGRLRYDFSLYQKNTNNLITSAPIDPSTGFNETTINIGEIRNRGVEFTATVVPVQNLGGFTWESTVNYSMYRTVVMELGGGLEEVVYAGFTNLGNFAIPGKPFGMIKGFGIDRTADGDPIVLPNGQYKAANDLIELGDPNPEFTASWINNLTYKDFTLSFMWEYRHGGVIVSNTVKGVLARGLSKDTDLLDRSLSLILPGVKESGTNADGSIRYVENDIQVTTSNYFFDNYFFTDEAITFDASTIRLREASFTYNLPSGLVSKTPFKRASLAFSATNIWFRALNMPKYVNFDTDVLSTGVGNGLGFDYLTGPSSRRFGGTLALTF